MIHEPFTVLPCPAKATTTLALEGCAEHALLRSDAKIDALAARIWKVLPVSGRAPFARGERSWLAYRAASCDAAASGYAGGSLQPVVYATCEEARDRTHVADLGGMLRSLTHP